MTTAMACCVFLSLVLGGAVRAWFAVFGGRRPDAFAPPARRSTEGPHEQLERT
ncbi:MAG TPA: hypothetical protein VHU88_02355 [Sporichthyaceae bacterium]|nr:hypothetical protein [Sporichthyaceae bacterium]